VQESLGPGAGQKNPNSVPYRSLVPVVPTAQIIDDVWKGTAMGDLPPYMAPNLVKCVVTTIAAIEQYQLPFDIIPDNMLRRDQFSAFD
jgi:hypothetical protein